MKLNKNIPVVWVTGASRGIGKEIATEFSKIGCAVILSGRNINQIKKIESNINSDFGISKAIKCDVTSEKGVKKCFDEIIKHFGEIDVLVNNAGVTEFLNFEKTTTKQFDKIISTNLKGTFLCTKVVLEKMRKRKSGVIININSVAAIKTFIGASVYSASKAGMLAMSRVLREEVRDFGIKIIDILPGPVDTEMWNKKDRKLFKQKMLSAMEVADVVVSTYCTPKKVLIEEVVIRPQTGDI